METTLNYLKNAWQAVKNKNNFFTILVALLLVSNAYGLAFSNIVFGILIVYVLFGQKVQLNFKINYLIPILFYIVMVLSLIWSIDKSATIKALSKEIYFLIIPLIFIFKNRNTPFSKDLFYKIFASFLSVVALFYIIMGVFNFIKFDDISYLVYHDTNYDSKGLVPYKVNAIYMSWFSLLAIFATFKSKFKNQTKTLLIGILTLFMFLLSSKNVIVTFLFLLAIYLFVTYKKSVKIQIKFIHLIPIIFVSSFALYNVVNRYNDELNKILDTDFYYYNGVRHVGLKSIFNDSEKYTPNDYFSGIIFRIYQYATFKKIIIDENKYLGVGLNAVQPQIQKVMQNDNLYEGYFTMNFHNQYLQITAELGLLGLLLMVWMIIELFYIAIRDRNFLAFCFTVSSFSLFLTESIFSRQRGILFFIVMYCLICYTKKTYKLKQ